MKIHVTGNAGSGKSTFGGRISEVLNLPFYGLDEIVWKENWVPANAVEVSQKIQAITGKDNWVIDGVSKEARAEAELIVFLDRSPLICAYRALKRNLPYLFRSRPGVPNNCPEIKIFPRLLKIIFGFNSLAKPAIVRDLKEKRHVVIKTDAEANEFLAKLVHNKL